MLSDIKCGTKECNNTYCVESTCECKSSCVCESLGEELASHQNPLQPSTPKASNIKYKCTGDTCVLIQDDVVPILEISSNTNFSSTKSIHFKNSTVVLPIRFERYKHPSHQHSLFLLPFTEARYCDICNEPYITGTVFSCFDCEYDLCFECFSKDVENEVPLNKEEDDKIDDML